MARLTRRSLNGAFWLFVERMVSPSVLPSTTLNRESFLNWPAISGAGKLAKASTSPAMIAATAAAASGMNLKVAVFRAGFSPQ